MNDPITLSQNAIVRLQTLLREEPNGSCLRISVLGGGCSGFQYEFSFDTQQHEDDIIIERDGAAVVLDEASIPFVLGSELDYEEDLSAAKFVLKNPNAATSCGCGNSFSI